jgi:hypothetical protein
MGVTADFIPERELRTMNPDMLCVQIAAKQHGLITREQALAAGLSPDAIARRLERGHWSVFFAGIYVIGGAPRTWWQELWAAKLWAGDGAFFTGRTGALLNRLDGVRDNAVEITAPRKYRAPAAQVSVRFTSRPPKRLEIIDRLEVAPTERLLVDLAAVEYKLRVELALDDALRKKKTTVPAMHDFLASDGHGLWGCGKMRRLLADRPVDAVILASKLENKFIALLEHSSLPPVVRHHEVTLANGVPTELDFAYPHVKVAPETDGYRFHSGRLRWQHDLDRMNALAEIGWLLLKFSWYDVENRPDYVISKIRTTIAQREKLFRANLRYP